MYGVGWLVIGLNFSKLVHNKRRAVHTQRQQLLLASAIL
jgi:hypothetical protein